MNYKDLGRDFGVALLEKDYDKAYSYFVAELASEMSRDEMIESFLDMVDYFSDEGPCNIKVEYPEIVTDLEEGNKMVYVPVVSDNEFGEAEGLSIVFNVEGKIVELEFGRP
jgi:hypothetical protein